MARLTEKDWKKLKSTNPYKGSFTRPIPRWTTGGRQGRAKAKAWDKHIADMQPKQGIDETGQA
jgi:hypothetical protein